MGDSRFDSPGKSAKYCTYSCQSHSTNEIVATSTIQTKSRKGSAHLELEGFKERIETLGRDSFEVSTVATDCNWQIAKCIQEHKMDINNRCYPCHFAKNIKSKLRPLAKRKGAKILEDWIKSIGNHLFWCAENCNGDPELLIRMWQSVLHHISDNHTLHPKYPKCKHRTYTKEERHRKKWIEKDSMACNYLENIINQCSNWFLVYSSCSGIRRARYFTSCCCILQNNVFS